MTMALVAATTSGPKPIGNLFRDLLRFASNFLDFSALNSTFLMVVVLVGGGGERLCENRFPFQQIGQNSVNFVD